MEIINIWLNSHIKKKDIESLKNSFNLPIETIEKKINIDKNIIEDLELKNNFIDLGETNKLISYIQDDRVSDVENPFIEKRQSIKVGRGIKSILNSTGLNFSDTEVEDFVNKYKAEFDKLNEGFSKFELVKGEDIRKWYLEENYDSIKSTLGSSCMRYGRCKFPAAGCPAC